MSWEDWLVIAGVAYAFVNVICWTLIYGSKP